MDVSQVWPAAIVIAVAALFLWRQVIKLVVSVGLVVFVFAIWHIPAPLDMLERALATVLAFVVASVVLKMAGIRGIRGNRAPPEPYRQPCFTCRGTGQAACPACWGTGQAPESRLHTLGKPVDCAYCGGSGSVRCSCQTM